MFQVVLFSSLVVPLASTMHYEHTNLKQYSPNARLFSGVSFTNHYTYVTERETLSFYLLIKRLIIEFVEKKKSIGQEVVLFFKF